MKLSPRVKLVLIAALFASPIAASLLVYHFAPPQPSGNYGELLAPAQITAQPLTGLEGGGWSFGELRGRWILLMSDSGRCPEACLEKLATLRQVQLALGRRASRVARVYVVDDVVSPNLEGLRAFQGTMVVLTPIALQLPPGAAKDRAHIYLVDPLGNVVMRWPALPDRKRMLRDLERLLKASQIG